MPIEFVSSGVFRKANLFESDCEAWVNTVNCLGVMGKGIAKEFKERFPDMYENYREACANGEVKVGSMHIYPIPKWNGQTSPRLIVNFPTKNDWRKPSELMYIMKGLVALNGVIKEQNIKSIAIPALGCSNGQLEWAKVKTLLEAFAETLPDDVKVVVFKPLT